MTITRFIVPLRGSSRDRYRHFHVLDKHTLKEFTIQYEAEIDGEWREIVRTESNTRKK